MGNVFNEYLGFKIKIGRIKLRKAILKFLF